MSARTWAALAGIALALLFAGLWLHQRDERMRAEGALGPLLLELDSARAQAARRVEESDSAAARARRREAQEAAARRAAEAEVAVLERRARELQAQQPAAADSIVVIAATGDTVAVRDAVDHLQQLHAQERATWEARDQQRLAVIRSQDLVIAELHALDETRVAAIDALERRALAAEAVADAALASRPGWLERNGWKVAVPVAAFLGWKAHEKWGGVSASDQGSSPPPPSRGSGSMRSATR